MNIDKKAGHIDPKVALSQAEHEKGTVPGQQIGLYGNADKRDVRQVVICWRVLYLCTRK